MEIYKKLFLIPIKRSLIPLQPYISLRDPRDFVCDLLAVILYLPCIITQKINVDQ